MRFTLSMRMEFDGGDDLISGNATRRDFLRKMSVAASAAAITGAASSQPLRQREIKNWDASADVVIVGAGAAGIAAAIEARRYRVKALVLEKFDVAGGTSSLSGGVCYMGGGTPLQQALGFADSTENMYNYMVAAAGIHAPRDRIQAYCEGSQEQFDWLVANGVRYAQKFSAEKEVSRADASLYYSGCEKVFPYRDNARPAPRGHLPPTDDLTGGRSLMRALLTSAANLGVALTTNVSVERLVQAGDGAVIGVEVIDNGERRRIRARNGVVLAAGGFIHNPSMLQRYAPELNRCSAPWGRAGDLGMGIRMGMSVGANALRMNQGFVILPLYPPEDALKGIVVNLNGQRFVPEDAYYGLMGYEIAYRQDGRAFLIIDATTDYAPQDYRFKLAAHADSIAALEAALKLPTESLQRTVDYYNRFAQAGQDPLYQKSPHYIAPLIKPPFKAYDLDLTRAFCPVVTVGGLHTNLNSQVIHVEGDIIPGLYAAGRTAASTVLARYIGSGMSIGEALFAGRRAGAHAAQIKR
jgi:succinate dehydrogenase/fumarate reductase flavoprotein subunit